MSDIADDNGELASIHSDSAELWLNEIGFDSESVFDRVSERAVKYAQDRGAELVTGIDEATRNDLATLISDGLADNIGMDAISDNIAEAYSFSEDRADLIARTEITRANQNGVLDGMREARDAGVSIQKVWLPDGEACDICLENGDDGPIDLDDSFSSGDDTSPAHPRCECTIASETDGEETDEE